MGTNSDGRDKGNGHSNPLDIKRTRRLEELGDLSGEATRLLPLGDEIQAGQSALGSDSAVESQATRRISDASPSIPSTSATALRPTGSNPNAPAELASTPTPDSPAQTGAGKLALSTLIVGGAFIISRVLGLVRETVIAGQFGTGPKTDAYQTAFGIPDTLFLLIIGGAVGSAFIPVFSGLMGKGKERQAWQLASTLINASIVLLSLGCLIMSYFAPTLVTYIIAPGTGVDHALVTDLTRILLLSPLLLGLGGWAMGILNARRHFLLPALAPIAYNLAIILGALFLAPIFGIYGVAWGVVLGSALHFAVQLPGLFGVGMRYSLRLNIRDEGVLEVARLILPRIIGQAAFQANIVGAKAIATVVATRIAGSVAAFNNAYQLMILPHGVFALSLATVTFPTMAAQYAEGNLEGMRNTLSRAIRVLLFLTLPSAVGMFFLRYDLVAALLQYGAFNGRSTNLVAGALGYFALGLVSYAVVEVVTRAFYALHDTKTPVLVSVATVALNLGLSALLVLVFGWDHKGLALSLALTTTLEMVLLWVLLGRKLPGWGLRAEGMMSSIGRSTLAASAMGVVLFLIIPPLENLTGSPGSKLGAILLTALGIVVGAAVYAGAAFMLRSPELQDAVGIVLRRRRR